MGWRALDGVWIGVIGGLDGEKRGLDGVVGGLEEDKRGLKGGSGWRDCRL